MKRILIVFSAALLMLWSCNKSDEPVQDELLVTTSEQDVPGQYVVLLKEGVTSVKAAKLAYNEAQELMRDEVQKVLSYSGIEGKELLQVYTSTNEGFAVNLSNNELKSLNDNPGVLGIWPDRLVTVGKPDKPPVPLPGQTTPDGINRVGGGGSTYTGGRKAWIIDTGIDLNHPDLNVDVSSSKSFVPRISSADDDNGHGTHVAGIIAARNNEVGVVGVAPGAGVVAVKVLDRRGSGYMSTIIAGVDYVTNYAPAYDAVNMSLGGSAYKPLDDAVIKMAENHYVSLAAGNEGDHADNHSPARANGDNIFTVSACDKLDKWAYFSNWGNPPVDFCAPGVSIRSLYKDGGMAIMSGTSMSAPHVCGILLLNAGKVHVDGYVSGDPDGNADPIAHR